MSPRAAGTNPMIALNSVDLPAPLTPTSAVIVPRGISKLASYSAVCPFLYVTVTLLTTIPAVSVAEPVFFAAMFAKLIRCVRSLEVFRKPVDNGLGRHPQQIQIAGNRPICGTQAVDIKHAAICGTGFSGDLLGG